MREGDGNTDVEKTDVKKTDVEKTDVEAREMRTLAKECGQV